MALFSRRHRVRLDEFCRDLYDKAILNPVVAGMDVGAAYFGMVKRSITEVDPGFGAVETQRFLSEMMLIRFEIVGLAWLHQLGDKHAAAQSDFTRRYLEGRGRTDIWDALEPYNQAVARSSTHGHTSNTPSGRAYLAFTNNMRRQLFNQWYKAVCQPKSVARAANRLFTDVAWQDGITAGLLILILCERLGCELNSEAQSRLTAVIWGLYNGVREELKMIKVEG